MVDTFTTKLLLKKPDPADTFNIGDASGVYDQIDAAVGTIICTAGTHPVSPWTGMTIFETDTGNGYIYSSANWMCTEGVFTSTTRPAHPFLNCIIYQTDLGTYVRWNGSAWINLAGPLGVISRHSRTSNATGTTSASAATGQGIVTLSVSIVSGRLYWISTNKFNVFTSTAPGTLSTQVELRYTIDGSTPTGSSSVLNEVNTGQMMGNGNFDPIAVDGLYVPTSNVTFRVSLWYWRTNGAGATMVAAGNASQPIVLTIEDKGIAPTDPGSSADL